MIGLASLLSLAENFINRYLRLDPSALQQLAKLEGQVIALTIVDLNIVCYLCPSALGIHLHSYPPALITAHVTGKPLALLKLAAAEYPQGQAGVSLEGDMDTLQALKTIMRTLDIDWEELLSQLLGDIAAHQIGNWARRIKAWQQQATQSLAQNTTELLQEELRYLPGREEVADFLQSIDEVRDTAERLQARVQRLQKSQLNL